MEWLPSNQLRPPPPLLRLLSPNYSTSLDIMRLSFTSFAAAVAIALNASQQVQAGPFTVGLCYSACNAGTYKRLWSAHAES